MSKRRRSKKNSAFAVGAAGDARSDEADASDAPKQYTAAEALGKFLMSRQPPGTAVTFPGTTDPLVSAAICSEEG